MAKKKHSQPLVIPSKSKKPSENPSLVKKPSESPSLLKKPSGNPSSVKKPSEVASTSKKPLKDVTTAKNKKQPEPVKIPPPESSSDEEDESESEEEEDEPSKDSGKNPVTPSASAPVVAATANQSSVSESESETDSETETATTKTPPPATAAASASPNKKRQSEGAVSMEVSASKRAKTESRSGTENKGLFQRIWSEEDEIVLLQGIIDFRSNTGKSHSDDLNGFFESVKNSLSFEVKSVHQFSSKIWSLRRKYVVKRKSGVEPSFTKPHDKRCLELAKIVWGTDVGSTAVKSKKKIKVEDGSLKIDDANVQADWFERSFLVGAITDLGVFVDEAYVREKWTLVPVKAKKMIDEKWKSLKAIELQSVLLKTDLVNDVSCWIAKSD